MIDLERQQQRLHHILSFGLATHFWSDSLGILPPVTVVAGK